MAFTETDPKGEASIALFQQVLQRSGWVDGDNVNRPGLIGGSNF
jgi:hypothetical protein